MITCTEGRPSGPCESEAAAGVSGGEAGGEAAVVAGVRTAEADAEESSEEDKHPGADDDRRSEVLERPDGVVESIPRSMQACASQAERGIRSGPFSANALASSSERSGDSPRGVDGRSW